MQSYVLGFAFDTNCRVALIRKDRPAWMAGRWNGIGGKLETGEIPHEAMSREFEEETGAYVSPEKWHHFATLVDKQDAFVMHCFVVVVTPEELDLVRTVETEEVRIFGGNVLVDMDLHVMQNLRWLMPMSLYLSASEAPVMVEFRANIPGTVA